MEQREKLIELLDGLSIDTHDDVLSVVDWLITNGVVALPCRCGECAFREDGNVLGNVLWCKHLKIGVSKDSYCSGGRRKDDIVDLCTTGHLHLGYVEEKGGE